MANPKNALTIATNQPIVHITIRDITFRPQYILYPDHLANAKRMIRFYYDWAPYIFRENQQEMVDLLLKHSYKINNTNRNSPKDHKLFKSISKAGKKWNVSRIATVTFLFLHGLYGNQAGLSKFREKCDKICPIILQGHFRSHHNPSQPIRPL